MHQSADKSYTERNNICHLVFSSLPEYHKKENYPPKKDVLTRKRILQIWNTLKQSKRHRMFIVIYIDITIGSYDKISL